MRERLLDMELESLTTPRDVYLAKFEEGAGIVEERIVGQEVRSPSVQLRVLPGGAVELLSTHDQLLGGASGQSYLGCTFPAAPEYAKAITQHAETIGRVLADQGALGRFAIDFVVVRDAGGAWTPYAIELNLRKGGTTHPFLTLQFLTDGRYDPATSLFLTPRGHEKHLVATDHLESGTAARAGALRPVRHRGATRTPLRPVATGRHRVPHDQLPDRARPDRPHRGRGLAGRGPPALRRGRVRSCWGRRGWPSRSARCRAETVTQRIWYVAYGSNLATARFRCYLSGGRPAGGSRDYVGCRDPRDPTRIEGVEVPGGLMFAGASRVWHGGMTFYDRAAAGVVAGCAYLVTTEQFADVAAQELRRPPGGEFAHDLSGLLPDVESVVTTGPGLYETVVRLGDLDGAPMFTITHHDVAGLAPAAPTAAYLRWITVGLREAHAYDDHRIARYLVAAPGVQGAWTEAEIVALAASGHALA